MLYTIEQAYSETWYRRVSVCAESLAEALGYAEDAEEGDRDDFGEDGTGVVLCEEWSRGCDGGGGPTYTVEIRAREDREDDTGYVLEFHDDADDRGDIQDVPAAYWRFAVEHPSERAALRDALAILREVRDYWAGGDCPADLWQRIVEATDAPTTQPKAPTT